LREANYKLEYVSGWKLFRSKDSRKREIQNERSKIEQIESKEAQMRHSEKLKLELELEKESNAFRRNRSSEIKSLNEKLVTAEKKLEGLKWN
jgi:hypothetical protein